MSLSSYDYILDNLSEAALYEQLAEECVELAHACQKKARLLRGENPTPLNEFEIDAMVEEEKTDVSLVCDLLDLHVWRDMYYKKIDRWAERLGYIFED